jgi:2-keto-4-pentenoate hydratase/2-oxohepta-3-ene-1,7-dioic acid hydratase in catechol pathway
MRLAMTADGPAAQIDGDLHALRLAGDLTTLIEAGIDPTGIQTDGLLREAVYTAPLRPGKIVAIGLNYRDHIAEAGAGISGSPSGVHEVLVERHRTR